ncbi:MAG: hypothetical protein ACM3II_00665 [Rhodospirillaceae bacterium]
MTVPSTSSRVIYLGNGSNTTFAFAFKVNQPADLAVVYTDAAGLDYALSPSQYAASGFGIDAGGSVTYPLPGGSPIASGTKLTIYRDVAVTQPTSLSNRGAMWPQVIEAALDRLTYVAQKVTDSVSRSLVISPTDSAALNVLPNATQRANSVLAFDSQGQPYAGTLTGSLVSVASWIANTLLPATTTQQACSALGAAYLAGGNAYTGTNDFTAGRAQVPTRSTGDNGTDAASTAFVKGKAESVVGGVVLRSYLAGLGLANNATTPNTKLDAAAGVCTDGTNVQMLSVTASTIDCSTVGANGLDTGSLVSNTWYHVFAIGKTDGTTALLASTSLGSPTLPATFTLKRRIGSFKTDGSAHIVSFIQNGDRFSWKTAIQDVAVNTPGNSAVLRVFSVPTGVRVKAWLAVELYQASPVNCAVLVTSPDVTDMTLGHATVPLFTAHTLIAGTGLTFGSAEIYRHTDASSQLRTKCSGSDGNTTLYMSTYGWIDRRGRDD